MLNQIQMESELDLREMNTFPRELILKIILPPFWKGIHSKRKEFAPLGSKFFPLRVGTFSEGDYMQERKQSQKLSPLYRMAEIYQVYQVCSRKYTWDKYSKDQLPLEYVKPNRETIFDS